ncbi:hypothetical protein BRADO1241 [Bradyrhizobium sp. ORS 278]|nr:hypothetical protein BRADO1241 [Bradyrhizobium sp. ORS 278]
MVRLPRPDMRPLQILSDHGGELTNLGELETIMKSGPVGVPPLKLNLAGPTLAGEQASTLSIGLGLSVLGTVLGAMGAGKLGLDVAYKGASKVTFEFTDTQRDEVEIAALDKFFGAADVDPSARGVMQLLEADEIYVVNATIKSSKITVTSKDSSGTDVTLKVPEIKEIVGANVSVSAAQDTSAKITYEGKIPLVFGFQAVRLFYEDGRYTSFEPLEAGAMAARELKSSGLPDGAKALTRRAAMLRIGNT